MRKLPNVLTDDERAALLAAPSLRAPTGLRNHCIMLLMLNAGLRVAETLDLKAADINWETGKLHVRQGKGKKDRILWLNESDLEQLAKWLTVQPVGSDLLFTTLKGGRIKDSYIRAMVKREALAAGIRKHIHPHMLRHTFATDIYRDTKNIRLTQKCLGHSDISTTMIYTHIVDDEVEQAMRTFRQRMSGKDCPGATT